MNNISKENVEKAAKKAEKEKAAEERRQMYASHCSHRFQANLLQSPGIIFVSLSHGIQDEADQAIASSYHITQT